MRDANARGEKLGLVDDELAFYDALSENESAVDVMGDETLSFLARELVATVRKNVTIDWTIRETTRGAVASVGTADATKVWLSTGYAREGHADGVGAGGGVV